MAVRALATVIGGAAVAIGACWSHFAPGEVARDTVEAGTLAQVGTAPSDSLTCGGGLKAKVGAAQTCTLVRDGAKFRVNLTVTGVDGDRVSWDSLVAGAPQSGQRVPRDELERSTREALARQRPVEAVTCDGALRGTVGATQTCTVTSHGSAHAVEARVVTADADHVQWSVTVLE